MNKSCALVICCLLLFASCAKQTENISSASTAPMDIQAQLGEAKHFDVPIPLGFKLTHKSSSKQGGGFSDFMRYDGTLCISDAISFYRREMERSGWDISDLSSNQEGFLYCTKPTKLCGIQIRSAKNALPDKTSTISLFITQKS